MRKFRGWLFKAASGESTWGNCPDWAAITRRMRPDMVESRVISYSTRRACPCH